MIIPSTKILKKNAAERVAASKNAQQVVLVYIGIVTLAAVLVTIVNYTLNLQINQSGGLGNMGLRSMLSTIQTVLPIVQGAALMCLELGYTSAMLRVFREQYISIRSMKLGFSRFWLLLRTVIFKGFLYMILSVAAFWISMQIFLLTPLSEPVIQIIEPLAADPSFSPEQLMELPIMEQLSGAMLPMLLLFGAVYLAMCIPIGYSLRLVNYIIIDKPGISALAAMIESKDMMRGSRMRLFKLDLSLWWWYLLSVLVGLVSYADMLLPMVGVTLPFAGDIAYFLFYALGLISQFALFFLLRNRVEVIYAQVYEARRPKPKNDGVVLGNIFQM